MPLANLPYHDLTGPLVRGVGEGGFTLPVLLTVEGEVILTMEGAAIASR